MRAVTGWSDEQKEAFVEMQFNAQHNFYQEKFPDAEYDLILEGDAPIGRRYVDRRSDEIRILDLLLEPDARGRGIGTDLLNELIGEAEVSAKPLRIVLHMMDRSVGLAERLGFRKVEEDGPNWTMEWTKEKSGDA